MIYPQSEVTTITTVRSRHLDALRACPLHPLGLRRGAYPSAMPVLAARGLVEERPARWKWRRPKETGWFLTEAGRETLLVLDVTNEESPARQ